MIPAENPANNHVGENALNTPHIFFIYAPPASLLFIAKTVLLCYNAKNFGDGNDNNIQDNKST